MGFFDIFKKKKKMSDGLEKTRTDFFQNIVNTLTSSVIDDDLYNDLEEQLILADVGPSCAVRLVDELRDEVEINGLHTGQEALDALRDIIRREVSPKTDLDLSGKPAVILVVGVNGVGKTTTIAKLAYLYKDLGKRVMLAAGDTFRAAASEQLETWADRAGVPLVKAGEGADPAAVIFDAVKSATARGYDMVIADTAGRLHNKKGLMDELAKISRSVKKASPDASLEVLLVLDAITGQNAISQAQEFCRAAGATGVVLTKLDGTPKGGCIIGVHEKLGLPIRFVGVGEKLDQVEVFHPDRMSSRILGMGDVLSLIEKAQQNFDLKKAAELQEKMKKNRLTLTDFYDQLVQFKGMGSMQDLAGMLPGVDAKALEGADLDKNALGKTEAIILSMTPEERENPALLNSSRKKRIAAGSGTQVVDVNRLLKQFEMMQQMTRQMAGMSGGKMARKMARLGKMKGSFPF